MSRLTVLPVVLVAALLALLAPEPLIGVVLAVLAAVPGLTRRRLSLSRPAELVLLALAGGLVLVVITPLLSSRDEVVAGVLRNGWVRLSVSTLTIAVVRLYLARPAGRDVATLGFALFAMIGCGGTRSEALFPVAVFLFLALVALARWGADPSRPPVTALSSRHYAAVLFAASLAGMVTLVTVAAVPPLHEWAMGRLLRMAPRAAMGFSERLWLGSLHGMLRSDEIVMRLRGPQVDHLRGATYDEYVAGRWTLSGATGGTLVQLPEAPRAPGSTEVEFVGPEPERYFLPLGARDVALDGGVATREPTGVLRPVAASVARRLWFVPGGRAAPTDAERAAPLRAERQVPPSVWRALRGIGRAWTEGADGPEAALSAIERHLREDYAYSLEFERPGGRDPVVSFLTEGKTGHCEYFASAMALLVRSVGIPARVVGGYRVTEYNPVGDYHVVRQRNAHAWVEAWTPESGWQTYDPTPPDPSVVAHTKMSWLSGAGDALRATFASGLRALDRLTWTELLAPLFLLVVAFALVRWWTSRGEAARRGAAAALRCFERLSRTLERRGLARGPAEPIESFARRVAQSGALGVHGLDATTLLMRYSALRYGGVGAEGDLGRDVEAFLGRLARRRR